MWQYQDTCLLSWVAGKLVGQVLRQGRSGDELELWTPQQSAGPTAQPDMAGTAGKPDHVV